ncbi:hypothetical protein BpHYR1_020414 [Brachionus plicatilis]|uniref:Secreted protein n=1 Tax=Brachionus plicatilis TaxID=10195 RepID=A0A3M7QRV0_BRAPC|nr:hypothetical protein BpHYR1_020414 [Brachionus plicatilis]
MVLEHLLLVGLFDLVLAGFVSQMIQTDHFVMVLVAPHLRVQRLQILQVFCAFFHFLFVLRALGRFHFLFYFNIALMPNANGRVFYLQFKIFMSSSSVQKTNK